MDTVMNLTAYGKNAQNALDAAKEEIERLDALFSISSAEGDIALQNANGGGRVSADTAALLARALQISEETDGAFDFTVEPVMEAWGFTNAAYRIPTDAELNALHDRIGYHKVQLSGDTVILAEQMKLDLGGIAKGFTSGRVIEIFEKNGISSGIISLGGNVQVLGTKPDGSLWRIAVQDPEHVEEVLAVLEVQDEAVVTSGGYERYFEKGGVRYHHIIDPHTGRPAQSGLKSVTVVSPDGTLADALSTALFVKGLAGATAYWQSNQSLFDAVLITDDGDIYVTEGLEDRCILAADKSLKIIR